MSGPQQGYTCHTLLSTFHQYHNNKYEIHVTRKMFFENKKQLPLLEVMMSCLTGKLIRKSTRHTGTTEQGILLSKRGSYLNLHHL